MSEQPRNSDPVAGSRFPGFDVMGQAGHWDRVTSDVILARVGTPRELTYFTSAEAACAAALIDQLTGQRDHSLVPALEMIDARLAAGETDGWRYADMPEDGQAWRDTLSYLDEDAADRCGSPFADAPDADQAALLQAVLDLKAKDWHGLPAAHVWSLWTRYACTAFYSHPSAWAEIGFPGPAYPRGYKNAGIGRLEAFEVADTEPSEDPVREEA
jgi:hypothetical protein